MVSVIESGRRADQKLVITVTANFTAEPLSDILNYWIEFLRLGPVRLVFSGYNQVFQELVAPNNLLSSNQPGVNLLLLRVEDWARDQEQGLSAKTVSESTKEFINCFVDFAGRAKRPTIILVCPPSRNAAAHAVLGPLIDS